MAESPGVILMFAKITMGVLPLLKSTVCNGKATNKTKNPTTPGCIFHSQFLLKMENKDYLIQKKSTWKQMLIFFPFIITEKK